MRDFLIHKETKELFKQDLRRVQSAIASLANQKFGKEGIEGINKSEGGVRVNGCEIAIHKDYVVDDFGVRGRNPPTPEEDAVGEAIEKIARDVEANGIECLSCYEPCNEGNPLRSLVE